MHGRANRPEIEDVGRSFSPPVTTLWPWCESVAGGMLALRKEESSMEASVGDRIIIRGRHSGDPTRDCEVLEVRGPDGSPPYVVRWGDSGHEAILYPGTDAVVQHFERTTSS